MYSVLGSLHTLASAGQGPAARLKRPKQRPGVVLRVQGGRALRLAKTYLGCVPAPDDCEVICTDLFAGHAKSLKQIMPVSTQNCFCVSLSLKMHETALIPFYY